MHAGMVWGWHFVPFALLWKPYEGVIQIWRASKNAIGEPVEVPASLGWWWASWLIAGFISNFINRLIPTEIFENLFLLAREETIAFAYAGSLFLFAIAAALLLKIVRQLTRSQGNLKNAVAADAFT